MPRSQSAFKAFKLARLRLQLYRWMSCTCNTFSPWLKRIPLFIPSDVAFLHVNSFSIMATKHLISKRNFRYSTRVCSTKLAQLRGQNRGKIKACNNWLGLNRRFLHFKTNLLSFVHFLRNSKLFLGSLNWNKTLPALPRFFLLLPVVSPLVYLSIYFDVY